jgi:hypothetical protein
MPDGSLKIDVTGPLADEIRAAAEACELSPDEWAAKVLARRMKLKGDETSVGHSGAAEPNPESRGS